MPQLLCSYLHLNLRAAAEIDALHFSECISVCWEEILGEKGKGKMGGGGGFTWTCLVVLCFCCTCRCSRCSRCTRCSRAVALPLLRSHSSGFVWHHHPGQEARTRMDDKTMTGQACNYHILPCIIHTFCPNFFWENKDAHYT